MSGPTATTPAPQRGAVSRSRSTLSPSAATASRASTATCSSSATRSPATACARWSPSASATTARRARSRSSSRRPSGSSRVADHPGAPWQVLPYERQLEVKHAQVDDALRRIGKPRRFELEPIVPAVEQWRYRNKLEYSFGAAPTAALVCGFHAPGPWEEIAPIERLPARLRARQRVRRAVARVGARRRASTALDRRTQTGLLRNLVVREGRRTGELQVRLVVGDGRRSTPTRSPAPSRATACS